MAKRCLPHALSGVTVMLTPGGERPFRERAGPTRGGAGSPGSFGTCCSFHTKVPPPHCQPLPVTAEHSGDIGAGIFRPLHTPPVGGPALGTVSPDETFPEPGCGLSLTTPSLPRLLTRV